MSVENTTAAIFRQEHVLELKKAIYTSKHCFIFSCFLHKDLLNFARSSFEKHFLPATFVKISTLCISLESITNTSFRHKIYKESVEFIWLFHNDKKCIVS